MFPSPYGVLFILMNSNFLFQDLRFSKGFPSPYGVSFILMILAVVTLELDIMYFRLLMEYHSFLYNIILMRKDDKI